MSELPVRRLPLNVMLRALGPKGPFHPDHQEKQAKAREAVGLYGDGLCCYWLSVF